MKRTRRIRPRFLKGLALALATSALVTPAAQALPQLDGYGTSVVATKTTPIVTDARYRPTQVRGSLPLITDARYRTPIGVTNARPVSSPVATGDGTAWGDVAIGVAAGFAGSLMLLGVAIVGRRSRLAHT
jgi:hypothetical protein